MLEILQDQVERGFFAMGRRLPSERKLALEHNAPQSRIHKKLQELVEKGYLECRRGDGYYVCSARPRKKPRRIAMCLESPVHEVGKDDFYTGLFFKFASEYAFDMNFLTIPFTPDEQNDFFLRLMAENTAGIIAFPHFIDQILPVFGELKKRKIPFFFWDYSPLPGVFPAVGVDHFETCFQAAGILAGTGSPVTYVGFTGGMQNKLKFDGFECGCRAFGVKMDNPIFIPYHKLWESSGITHLVGNAAPGKVYFTSTLGLTESFVGTMFDRGFLPARDYLLLATDCLKMLDGSSLQFDCMMRDRAQIIRKLLSELEQALSDKEYACCDYRFPMRYVPGMTLKT